MSSNQLRQGNVRIAIGDRLHAAWNPDNVAGYDPTLATSEPKHLDIHLGHYDEEHGFPQLGLIPVSGGSSGRAWKPDGSGLVVDYDGRVDIRVFVGSEDDLPEDAQLLAESIGEEVRDILHDTQYLMDPVTDDLLVEDVQPLSQPVVNEDTELADTRFFATVEIGYLRSEEPPQR